MRKTAAILATASYLLAFGVVFVQAASPCPSGAIDCINLGEAQQGRGIGAVTPLSNILANTFTIVFAVAALLVLAFLIFGAFKWITSGGDKEGAAGARKYIINALVGLAILALAFVIVRVVGGIVGFSVLQDFVLPRLDASPRPS